VLIDDFSGAASHIRLQNLLRITDRYPMSVPVKGGFVNWAAQRIYITTNIHPRAWYDWSTREEQYTALVRRFTTVVYFGAPSEAARATGIELAAPAPVVIDEPHTVGPGGLVVPHRFWAGPTYEMVPDTKFSRALNPYTFM